MNLVQLQTFLSVARLGSFSKAADQLYTTQPAISARIAGLEESLGVTLFNRQGGAVTLTAKGVELQPMAERLLGLAADVKLRIGDASAVSGILRIGVAETIVHTWLPAFLKAAHETFPALDLEVSVDVSVNMRDAVVARDLDLAFLMGPISEYSVTNLPLCRYPLVWVASPRLTFEGAPVPFSALLSLPILTYAHNTRPYAEIADRARKESLSSTRIFGSTSLSAAKQMALQGIGVASLPDVLVADELESGALVKLAVDWAPSELLFTASHARAENDSLVSMVADIAHAVASPDDKSK